LVLWRSGGNIGARSVAENRRNGVNYFSPAKRETSTARDAEPRLNGGVSGSPEILSTFGAGMLITGQIHCPGALQIFGRIQGDVQASHIVICEGGQVEGTIVAQEAVVQGTFNGTIHGNSVKLQGKAVVDGEIFNKSLAIEPNVQFQGVSRRLERNVEAPASEQPVTPAPVTVR
jgi:cytoskeletal protein CcmA (bactofilin family)